MNCAPSSTACEDRQVLLQDAIPVASAIILAGGLGTRLRSVVPDRPKPMALIHGRPFLEYQLDYWIMQGIRTFILSVGYRHEMIMEHFGSSYHGARVRYAIENEPLGTGGGLLLAAGQLESSDPVLILNGDTFFEVSLAELADFHRCRRSLWTFSLFRTRESGRYMGMGVAADGRIESLCSRAEERGDFLANGGVYLADPVLLSNCGFAPGNRVSLEDDLLPVLAREARLFGCECAGQFIDIGVPEDYFRAGDLLAMCEEAQ